MKRQISTILAIAIFNFSVSTPLYALDLYVDTKTKQIFAEPGPGRVHLGTYEKSGSSSAKAAPETSRKTEVTELAPTHENA
ncbi:MAG TPA: porin, partial [Nitrosomonas sp.]|nr:porin [Nitrosomonas sp.]